MNWLDTFRHLHPHDHGATHLWHWPWGGVARRLRLDYIFLRSGNLGWEVCETRHLEPPGNAGSDHRAVLSRYAPVIGDP
jgi:endonuclease/exonuclease/phosphatase (EEP) superfamily protein YafD